MAVRLFRIYRNLKTLFLRDDCWESIAGFIYDCLEEACPSLRPLILYYLVLTHQQCYICSILWNADYKHFHSTKSLFGRIKRSSLPILREETVLSWRIRLRLQFFTINHTWQQGLYRMRISQKYSCNSLRDLARFFSFCWDSMYVCMYVSTSN